MVSTPAGACRHAFMALAINFSVACVATADAASNFSVVAVPPSIARPNWAISSLNSGGENDFAAPQSFATGASPNAVASGDINSDGKPDLISANYADNSISVLLNTGAPNAPLPSFAAQQIFAAGPSPQSVALADINGDGKVDVVVSNGVYPGTVSVLLNTTAPNATSVSFAAPAIFATGGVPYSVTAVDVNGDGKPDLVVANTSDGTISVLLNTTVTGADAPSFAAQQVFAVGLFPVSIAVADMNSDGKPDLVVANSAPAHSYSRDGTISVLLNTTVSRSATARFADQQLFDAGLAPAQAVIAVDIDGDGKPDLVVANGSTITVLLNATVAGAATLDFATQGLFATAASSLGIADINGDGKPDLVVTSFLDDSNEGTAWELINTTAPGATQASFVARQTFPTGLLPVSIASADFNGDGRPDFVVADFRSNDVAVILNRPAVITVGGYLSGNWFNPAQRGHGFQIEATNAIDAATGQPIILAIWFVYTPDGSGQNWIYAQGTYDPTSNMVSMRGVLTAGAGFPPAFASGAVTETDWGNLAFDFTDCNHGTVTWSSSLPGYGTGSMPITRLTQIAGTACPP